MTHDDLKRLQAYRGYPALSLRVPTHRRMPEAMQDPTRLKNLIRRAERALQERDVASPLIHDFVSRLEIFHRQLDWRYLDQGLCIFVAAGRLAWVMLPEPVEETVVVGETFLTRDLVRVASRTPRYAMLVLSEQASRWFEGWGRRLHEETGHGFPMANDVDAGEPPEGFNKGVDPMDYDNACTRLFMRQVAAGVRSRLDSAGLPLFVVGVDRLRSLYQEVAGARAIAGEVAGNFDDRPLHELADAVEPVVEHWQQRRRSEVLARFDAVKGTESGARGLRAVGEAAAAGRVDTLLLESQYQISGTYDRQTGRVITAANGGEVAAGEHDLVDEIVETVLEKGGDVVFYQSGRLDPVGSPLCALLRY